MTKQKESKKPVANKDKYPFWDEIRASWTTNKTHCDPESPSKRETFINNEINFATEWTGEVGFLRYYLFHVDSGYVPKKSKLQRIDENKGFYPQNCIILHKGSINDLEPVESKSTVIEPVSPMNVTNNFIIIDNADTVIKALLSNLNVQSLALVDKAN